MDPWDYPHSIAIVGLQQLVVDGIKQPPTYLDPVAARADIQRTTASRVLADYALEATEPAVLYAPISDAAHYEEGYLIEEGGDQWVVLAVQKSKSGDPDLDGVVAVLELNRMERDI